MEEQTVKLNIAQLNKSIADLALPSSDQIDLFPDFVNTADELADSFGNWSRWVLECDKVVLSNSQREKIRALDDCLSQMSGPEQAELWTDEALQLNPTWEQIRSLAKSIASDLVWEYRKTGRDDNANERRD